jgi:hypothetical protein
MSPSTSPSSSESSSQSISPSDSPSASPSTSPSTSPSSSPSIPPDKDYSRGEYDNLSVDDADLITAYTPQDVMDVETDNDVEVGQDATANYSIHLYKNSGTGDKVRVNWKGKSTLAPSSSAVYLQIYNQTTSLWETLTSNNSANADTDFELIAYSTLIDYQDENGFIACRIYQNMETWWIYNEEKMP